jgi:hypothetical protein
MLKHLPHLELIHYLDFWQLMGDARCACMLVSALS